MELMLIPKAGVSCRKLKKEDVRWIALFRSDFRFVAEFFVKQRTDPGYTPTEIEIQHVDEVLKLLSVFTGDERFLDLINRAAEESVKKRGEKKVMSSAVLDYREAKGKAEGRAEGRSEGQDLLVETVQRIRAGETAESIIESGVDEETVRRALMIL